MFNIIKKLFCKPAPINSGEKQPRPIKRLIIRRGFSYQLNPSTLLEGELGFNVDDHKLVIGTKEGYQEVSKVKIVDGVLCTDIDGRLIPLCIKWPHT